MRYPRPQAILYLLKGDYINRYLLRIVRDFPSNSRNHNFKASSATTFKGLRVLGLGYRGLYGCCSKFK